MADKNQSKTPPAEPQPARTAGDLNNAAPGDNSQPIRVPVKDVANEIAEPPPIELDELPKNHPEYEALATIKLERDLSELAKEDMAGSGDEVGWEEAKENREAALAEADEDVQKIQVVNPPAEGAAGTPDSGEPGTAPGDDTPNYDGPEE